MTDGYGRSIDYLRISLTDKCSLRCGYCMPAEGIRHLSHDDILSLEEIQRIAFIMTGLGIKKVRLTGGEPLVRRGVVRLVEMLSDKTDTRKKEKKGGDKYANEEAAPEIVMTTNGIRLPEMAADLKEAGLSGVNISLDTLNRDTFIRLTGYDELEKVLSGIAAASESGLTVKLNCVPVRGINDSEIKELVSFAEDTGADIRFIELMPIGCGGLFEGIPSGELIKKLEEIYGTAEMDSSGGKAGTESSEAGTEGLPAAKGPAEYYRFDGLNVRVGFISPMSHCFCERCNRVRLTAEGFLKLCLQYPYGIDLRGPLRAGASDDEIRDMICRAVERKPASHSFGDGGSADNRKMIQIGG
ncbi:MAG: GTP 3',8-cyclase MoaA [Lachnospiraceae bacterium]|nr:GTP 3',8-cyclase MoaA [Lachnospiraceae bacterium]